MSHTKVNSTVQRALLWCAVSTPEQAKFDKYSLPEQEAQERAWCEQNGYIVTDVLRVPGHSRYYIDIHECAADMAKQGIYALTRLMELWKSKPRSFDVLVCRDFTRFARRAAMLTYIVEATLDAGALIYSLSDGWVNIDNSSIVVALAGFKTRHDISDLQVRKNDGMKSRMDRGLSQFAVLRSHKLIFDDKGKPSHLELNPDYSQLWIDLATLLLEGVSWRQIGVELYARFGHTTDGKPYTRAVLYKTMHNPYFWGHAAKDYGNQWGDWVFDENLAPPDGVMVNRNTHPAVYTGELAELVRSELRRRRMIEGRARPGETYPFTGLLRCDACGYYYVADFRVGAHVRKEHRSWRCGGRYAADFVCRNPMIANRIVQQDVNKFLIGLIADGTVDQLLRKRPDDQAQITVTRRDLDRLSKQLSGLIDKQTEPELAQSAQDVYTRKIIEIGRRIDALKQQLRNLEQISVSPVQVATMHRAYAELCAMGLEQFWLQESRVINQLLHRLMGNKRFVVGHRTLIGIIDR